MQEYLDRRRSRCDFRVCLREWLMRDVGSRYGTNNVSTIIKIAQIEVLLSPNAEMTDVGQSYVTANRRRVEVLKHDTIVYPL